MNTIKFDNGDKVHSKMDNQHGSGRIKARFIQNTELELEGKTITHKATAERPAYLVEFENEKYAIRYEDQLEAERD